MEENIPFKQKLINAAVNIRLMMQSDRRILFGVIGIGILVVVFIIIAFMSFSSSKKAALVTTQTPSNVTTTNRNTPSVAKQKISATLSLVLTEPKKVYKVHDLITFTIVGDSADQQVRGYDAAFKFDPTRVSFVSDKNLLPSLQYMRRIRGNWILITSTQPIGKTNAISFSKTKLTDITFKATAAGAAYFPMSYIPDSYNDSNLIDTASNDMLSSATGIVVQIVP